MVLGSERGKNVKEKKNSVASSKHMTVFRKRVNLSAEIHGTVHTEGH